jgi:formyltetrahydrofolate synthetase
MADRTYSETENSRYGRYINLDILDDLLESIHELKDDQKFILSLDESVEDTLHDVIKTYLKWHQIKVIPNAKKNVLGTLHQSPNRLVLVAEEKKSFPYFYDNLDTEINVDN